MIPAFDVHMHNLIELISIAMMSLIKLIGMINRLYEQQENTRLRNKKRWLRLNPRHNQSQS